MSTAEIKTFLYNNRIKAVVTQIGEVTVVDIGCDLWSFVPEHSAAMIKEVLLRYR